MRGRMIALGITTFVARHCGVGPAELHGPGNLADRGDAAVDLADFVHVDAPSFAEDFAGVRDLTA